MASQGYQYNTAVKYDLNEKGTPLKIQKWELGATKENPGIRRSLTAKAKATIVITMMLFIMIVTVLLVTLLAKKQSKKDYWFPEYESQSRLGRYQHAAVSTDAAPCAPIGKDILSRNGSAVDAAIAVLLCMGVVNPQSCGLGGGFLMVYYNREQKSVHYIDARETAPAAATVDMMGGNATVAKYGGLAVAVPGELAGYYDIHQRFGKLPWKDLFEPTIKMCREGIEVNGHLERALKKSEYTLRQFDHVSKLFTKSDTGALLKEGDVYYREDLARTMEAIARDNVKAIYGPSPLATKFLQDLKDSGSIITESDMLNFKPLSRKPVSAVLRGNMTVFGASLPGSGHLVALILQVLDGYPDFNPEATRSKESTVLMLHRLIETFKFAYAQRAFMEDDDVEGDSTSYMKTLLDDLTSKEYADNIRKQIDDDRTYDDPRHYGMNVSAAEDHGTAHVSIVAPNGDAVAVTSTVNLYFGSMVLSPSTGILLNNEMDDFSSPNVTNYFGVPPTGRNHIRAGRKPFSSMTPSIVVDKYGDVVLNLGGNGGTQITTSVAQTILRNIFLKENIKKCIDAPRFHHQLLPNSLDYEPNFPEDILTDLMDKGHKLRVLGEKMLGIIMGVERQEDGFLYANSDYRKGGDVDGF